MMNEHHWLKLMTPHEHLRGAIDYLVDEQVGTKPAWNSHYWLGMEEFAVLSLFVIKQY